MPSSPSPRISSSQRGLFDQEPPVVELSSGQTVVAIGILICIALLCYVAGYLTHKWESGGAVPVSAAVASTSVEPVGVQTSGTIPDAGRTAPAKSPEPSPSSTAPKSGETAPAAVTAAPSSEPRTVDLPKPAETQTVKTGTVSTEPPARLDPPPTPPERPQQAQSPESPTKPDPTAAVASTSATETTRVDSAAATQQEDVALARLEDVTPADEPKAPKPDQPGTAAPGGSRYGVQIRYFALNERTAADKYVSSLKQDKDIDAVVVKSKDGSRYRVIVGDFASKKDAEARREELKKLGFADCWVLPI